MNMHPKPQIVSKLVDSREVFICDDYVDNETMGRVNEQITNLVYSRTLVSRLDNPIGGSVAHIRSPLLEQEPFYAALRHLGESMFPTERFHHERTYVNHGVHGDVFLPHSDCERDKNDVTVLYYGNLNWHSDWCGETVFYRAGHEAELAVTPRPGRIVVFRGSLLHRGGVPSRICFEARLTISCKLRSI